MQKNTISGFRFFKVTQLLFLLIFLHTVPINANTVLNYSFKNSYLTTMVPEKAVHVFRVKNLANKRRLNDSNLFKLQNAQQALARAIDEGYLAFILVQLSERHLPNELALIPLIESNYRAYAVSPKGAAGLWQLMPQTAWYLGIRPRQRFELMPATIAALDHLQALNREFGNWTLAIAAYNAGSKAVRTALLKAPQPTVKNLALPKETKDYVANFMWLCSKLDNPL